MGGVTGAPSPVEARCPAAAAPGEYVFTAEPPREYLPPGPDTPLVADPCHPAARPWADSADILLCRCGHAPLPSRETGRKLLRAHPGCLVAAVHGPDGRGTLATPQGLVLVTPGATVPLPAGYGAPLWGTVAAAALVYAWLVGGHDLTALPDTVLRSARNPTVPSPVGSGGDGVPVPERVPVPGRPLVHEVYVRAEPR
ncbi:hypothetical protein CQJ94_01120 [Glycomyces fuscus]|nr:hypothetical protein CQJ94_01120 [Glycomyces fuscus]